MATSNVRILVVDDERFYRGAIREILAAEGLVCVEAEGGERAVELARDEAVGVVVLDLRLANDDALDVLRRLNELRPELRVVVLSASSDQELVLDALRLGACDYLAKPLHDEELVLAIQRAVESYRLSAGWAGLRSRLDGIVGRMEALSRLAGVAKDDERRELIHEAAARIVSEVLEAEKTSLMTLDDEAGSLYVSAVRGRDLAPGAMDPVLVGEGAAGMVLESGEPLLVGDVKADARFAGRAPTGRYQTHSFVLAPLEARGRFIGVLCATDRADGSEFEQDDLLLLRVIAVQVAELLASESPADEETSYELHMANDLDPDAELARLVCDAVVNEVEPERVVRAALRPLAEFLPASPVSLYLVDGQTGVLLREGQDDVGGRSDRLELPRQAGLTGVVLQTGQLVATQEPEADGRFDPRVDTPDDGVSGPLLCVPLKLRGKTVGVCRAFLTGNAQASPRTCEVLVATLSAAVRSVLLYRSLVQSIEEVAEARRATR